MLTRRHAIAAVAGAAAAPGFALANTTAPLQPAPPFELTAHDGRRIQTDRDFSGQPMLVYFGYTYCPDVCPSSLIRLASALHELEDSGRAPADLTFLFVSVDPERDTLEKIADYVSAFHPRLIGATGTPEEIAAVAADWRVKYNRAPGGSATDYLVDHPSYAFGLNRRHQVVSYLWHYASSAKLAEKILQLSED